MLLSPFLPCCSWEQPHEPDDEPQCSCPEDPVAGLLCWASELPQAGSLAPSPRLRDQSKSQGRQQQPPLWLLGCSLDCMNWKKKKKQIRLEPLVEGSPRAGLHSSGPGKALVLNSPKWLSHFNSNTRFSFSKVLIQLDLDLFGWVICLKGIISRLLTVVISLLRWLKHLFSAIFSSATHPTPTN